MFAALIIAAEVSFWLLLGAGLWSRYGLGRPRLGAVLLALTPAVDLVVLGASVVDLRGGAVATSWHALAAVYIGVSVAFGPSIVAWADARFAHRYAGAPLPARPARGGPEHARRERDGWYRHLLAWVIGATLLVTAVVVVGDAERTAALQHVLRVWTAVLAIDFLVSFSYTLWPRQAPSALLGLARSNRRVLDVAVAVRRDRHPLQRLELGLVVQAALQLGEDDSEQQVAPGGLGERAPVAAQGLELGAGGVVAVDQHAERPEAEVLGHRGGHAGDHGRPRHERARQRVGGAEHRSVRDVEPEPRRGPRGPARDELAEQLHVVVARAEDPLVERLLGGPDRRGRRARQGAVQWSPKLHCRQRNGTARNRVHLGNGLASPGAYHERTRRRGVNPFVYWPVRWVVKPAILVYFRLRRLGTEHVPDGGVILASNHRSFLDPFAIGCCIGRPIYFVAKQELFKNPLLGWLLNCLGAFPIKRGASDEESMDTALALLERGQAVVIFPEGTRIRTGSLAQPKRGVGRLALQSGKPVVPIAVTNSENARRGWRIRPVKVHIRCGPPLTFPRVEDPSPFLAGEVTERIWPCVELQWEWLGGLPPLRTAAVVGAGCMGTAASAVLARAGVEVQLGCRTGAQAEAVSAARENTRYLPGLELDRAHRRQDRPRDRVRGR